MMRRTVVTGGLLATATTLYVKAECADKTANPNCAVCTGAEKTCTECDATFVLVKEEGQEVGTCTACAEKFSGCTACNAGSITGTDPKCDTCDPDTHESAGDGTCKEKTPDPTGCADAAATANPNCAVCSEAEKTCSKCSENFVLVKEDGLEVGTCQACSAAVAGCTTCNAGSADGTETAKCGQCDDTHEADPDNDGACKEKTPDPTGCADAAATANPNCAVCSEAEKTCSKCSENFVLVKEDGLEVGTCQACSAAVAGCTTCNAGSADGTETAKCGQCDDTHEADPDNDGACKEKTPDPTGCADAAATANPNCAVCSEAEKTCSKCSENFVLVKEQDQEVGTCTACAEKFPGCTACNAGSITGTDPKCDTCDPDTHESAGDGTCKDKTPTPEVCVVDKDGCTECDADEKKCTACDGSHDLVDGACKAKDAAALSGATATALVASLAAAVLAAMM
ncbi:hypothetical protein, conserved [Angomonas deanei]|uniref:Uncharacterized protein n=1 Tax=Angomonas deanei TaxID=59799 RepID=A0A7G2CV46_9TRYP|nr:hypothetical protein, conserved [Angomonas deanei]